MAVATQVEGSLEAEISRGVLGEGWLALAAPGVMGCLEAEVVGCLEAAAVRRPSVGVLAEEG